MSESYNFKGHNREPDSTEPASQQTKDDLFILFMQKFNTATELRVPGEMLKVFYLDPDVLWQEIKIAPRASTLTGYQFVEGLEGEIDIKKLTLAVDPQAEEDIIAALKNALRNEDRREIFKVKVREEVQKVKAAKAVMETEELGLNLLTEAETKQLYRDLESAVAFS